MVSNMNENVPQTDSPSTDEISKARKAGSFIQQLGLNMLMVGLLALLAFLVWQRFTNKGNPATHAIAPQTANRELSGGEIQPAAGDLAIDLQPLVIPDVYSQGILRQTDLKTIIPSRPRTDVITYTVQTGDTLFSIAENYGLKPETVLWGNFEVLNDNPHLLKPKQVLNILPTDGTYYQWHEGDTLSGVASFFKVDPQNIINYPGNALDLTQTASGDAGIAPDTWVIIPGGKRAIKDWGPPAITRQNPASARYYGEGSCGSVYEGAYGTGTFVWPTTDHTISGYSYDPGVHPAIDIGGQEGNPIYATDSGVIVYAGWSDYGYGNLIVIDHGNGWQSAYAHLSVIAVSCGQSVYQGGYIGAMGTTGNSSGPHLHFELVINGAKVNPLDYIQ
jgi:murein DD-endopeptidase MepM/ murein hydrolase activator NlpD